MKKIFEKLYKTKKGTKEQWDSKTEMLFVIPQNDGEAVEIKNLLQEQNVPFLVTSQGWGASWEGLEEEVKEQIKQFKGTVFGVELQGIPSIDNFVNIDHHKYDGDDRSNELSSLEQVAELLEVKLTDFQKAVSWNDKGFIPLMEQNNVSMETISLVRQQDRSAQGITEEQEEQAEEACKGKVVQNDLTIVKCKHSKTSCITDRLYGQYENLLVLSEDGEVNFFGDGKICEKLHIVYGGWTGGQLPVSGYWGGYPSNQEEVINTIRKEG